MSAPNADSNQVKLHIENAAASDISIDNLESPSRNNEKRKNQMGEASSSSVQRKHKKRTEEANVPHGIELAIPVQPSIVNALQSQSQQVPPPVFPPQALPEHEAMAPLGMAQALGALQQRVTQLEGMQAAVELRVNEIEDPPPPQTIVGRFLAFYHRHQLLLEAVKFCLTVIVAFMLGYFQLKKDVDALGHKLDDLRIETDSLKIQTISFQSQLAIQQDLLNAEQSQVSGIQLNVQSLQGPVASLVTQVNSLNLQGLQSNISMAQQKQTEIIAANAGLQLQLQNVTVNFQSTVAALNSSLLQTLATATASYNAFQAQLTSSIQLHQIDDMQHNISSLGDQFRGVQSNLSLLDQGTQITFSQLRAQNVASQLATNATIARIQSNITQMMMDVQQSKRIATVGYSSGSGYTTTSTTPVVIPNMSLQWRLLPGDSFWVYFSFTGYVSGGSYAYFHLLLPAGVEYAVGSLDADGYLQNLLETPTMLRRVQASANVTSPQDVAIQANWRVDGGTGIHYSSTISAFV